MTPKHTPKINELIGNALDQVSYAMRYQHGENLQELQKACYRIAEIEPIITKIVDSHDELLNALKSTIGYLPYGDGRYLSELNQIIAKAEGK